MCPGAQEEAAAPRLSSRCDPRTHAPPPTSSQSLHLQDEMRGPGAPTTLGPSLATFQMGEGHPLAPGPRRPLAARTANALALATGQPTPHGHTQEHWGASEAREEATSCQHLPTVNFEAGPDHIMYVKEEKRLSSPCIQTVTDLLGITMNFLFFY